MMPGNIFKTLAILVVLLTGTTSCSTGGKTLEPPETFEHLDEVCRDEKNAILKHFEGLAKTAGSIADDSVMINFFKMISSSDTHSLISDDSHILDAHFVQKYGVFYDALFVSSDGFVQYSIKQEKDHHTNLITGSLSGTALAACLKTNPEFAFVDFRSYGPSGEPASFFVSRVHSPDSNLGWFVLQYGSNELNTMLSQPEWLGRTGETYLVNEDRLMLSDSRFVNESSILKMPVNTDPVRLAFSKGQGHIQALDYRGVPVFSSFDTLNFMDNTWTLLVEIDKDEIINEFYLENSKFWLEKISRMTQVEVQKNSIKSGFRMSLDSENRVDTNELKRVNDGEMCWTAGVGPCTAIIAWLPDEFGYLLHVGPTDTVYLDDPLTKVFLGTRKSTLVSDLMDRILRFDVVPNDLNSLKFVVVATHASSLQGILDTLMGHGIFLSQITFVQDSKADFANVSFDQANNEVNIQWVNLGSEPDSRLLKSADIPNLASYITAP